MDRSAILVDAGYLIGAATSAARLGAWGTVVAGRVVVHFPDLIAGVIHQAYERTRLPLLRLYWYSPWPETHAGQELRTLQLMTEVKVRVGVGQGEINDQAGVSTPLQRDLLGLARNHGVCDVVILTADENLVPIIEEAQSYGVKVHLWGVQSADGSHRQSSVLIATADSRLVIAADWVKQFTEIVPADRADTPIETASERPEPFPVRPEPHVFFEGDPLTSPMVELPVLDMPALDLSALDGNDADGRRDGLGELELPDAPVAADGTLPQASSVPLTPTTSVPTSIEIGPRPVTNMAGPPSVNDAAAQARSLPERNQRHVAAEPPASAEPPADTEPPVSAATELPANTEHLTGTEWPAGADQSATWRHDPAQSSDWSPGASASQLPSDPDATQWWAPPLAPTSSPGEVPSLPAGPPSDAPPTIGTAPTLDAGPPVVAPSTRPTPTVLSMPSTLGNALPMPVGGHSDGTDDEPPTYASMLPPSDAIVQLADVTEAEMADADALADAAFRETNRPLPEDIGYRYGSRWAARTTADQRDALIARCEPPYLPRKIAQELARYAATFPLPAHDVELIALSLAMGFWHALLPKVARP